MNDIFDKDLLLLKRKKSKSEFEKYNFLVERSAEDICERLSDSKRDFRTVLDIGSRTKAVEKYLVRNKKCKVLEKSNSTELLFERNSFDLIYSVLDMHNINDLPGLLLQVQGLLKKDGIFVASLFGSNTLKELKSSILETEIELGMGTSPHVLPFVDTKSIGSLMQKIGFDMIISDADPVNVQYKDVYHLIKDIRGMGEGNVLIERSKKYLGKDFWALVSKKYNNSFSNMASFEIITITGMKALS